jgi:hypothetical protein
MIKKTFTQCILIVHLVNETYLLKNTNYEKTDKLNKFYY